MNLGIPHIPCTFLLFAILVYHVFDSLNVIPIVCAQLCDHTILQSSASISRISRSSNPDQLILDTSVPQSTDRWMNNNNKVRLKRSQFPARVPTSPRVVHVRLSRPAPLRTRGLRTLQCSGLYALAIDSEAMAFGSEGWRCPWILCLPSMLLPSPTLRATYAGRVGRSRHCDKKAPNSLFWILVAC
jgi:hypothetical protein